MNVSDMLVGFYKMHNCGNAKWSSFHAAWLARSVASDMLLFHQFFSHDRAYYLENLCDNLLVHIGKKTGGYLTWYNLVTWNNEHRMPCSDSRHRHASSSVPVVVHDIHIRSVAVLLFATAWEKVSRPAVLGHFQRAPVQDSLHCYVIRDICGHLMRSGILVSCKLIHLVSRCSQDNPLPSLGHHLQF